MRKLLIAFGMACVIAGQVVFALNGPAAHADPVHPCMPTDPCRTPQYCPDTGGFVVGYQPCASLVTGPYLPGGLQPPDDDGDR